MEISVPPQCVDGLAAVYNDIENLKNITLAITVLNDT